MVAIVQSRVRGLEIPKLQNKDVMRFFLELRPYVDYTQLKLFLLWAKFVLRLIRFSIKTNTSRGLSNLPMTHLESIASSAVRPTLKVKAFVIIGLTSSGRAARLIAKYRPTMPVLSVVIPRLKTNQLKWSFSGAFEVYHFLKFYNI